MKKETYICDFCGRSEEYVKQMLIGPNNICICNSCVDVSVQVLKEVEEKKRNIVVN
jgi:ATP-dependent protease Clp ATPase subunit